MTWHAMWQEGVMNIVNNMIHDTIFYVISFINQKYH